VVFEASMVVSYVYASLDDTIYGRLVLLSESGMGYFILLEHWKLAFECLYCEKFKLEK